MQSDLSSSPAAHRPATAAQPRGGNPLSEFFRYHGVWAPGVRLFRALRFRSKALTIALAFLGPMGWMGLNYFSLQAEQIAFSAKEDKGLSYAAEVTRLLPLLQRQRLYSLQEAAAGTAPPELAAARQAADAQLERLAAAEKALGADLATGKAYGSFIEAGRALPAGSAGVDAVFAAHNVRVQALLTLLTAASDGSNLSLDPELDTYYLVDASVMRLPGMLEQVAQVRGLGAAMLKAGTATLKQQRVIIERTGLLRGQQATLDADLAKAYAQQPALRSVVKSDAAQAAMGEFLALVEATVLNPDGLQGEVGRHIAAGNRAVETMAALAEAAIHELDRLVQARVARLELARNLSAGVIAAGLLTALYLFMSFGRVLDGGLREVAYHIDAMRDGDLTTSPRAWGADEVARLMNTLVEMQASLRGIVGQVRGASDSIVTASTQISSGALDLSARTEQSAANLQQTAATMEEIAATVKSNEGTVGEAERLAQVNAQGAQRGGQIIGQVVATMQQINSSSARIGDIIGTIDSIAFQTNILALNAAVEAARAGEQGRGFAVVATEVRALAQRSSQAAREIKTLIGASLEEVERGSRVVRDAGSTIEEIVGSSGRVSQLLAEVAGGAREQTLGIAQSTRAVHDLDGATQQNAALVEETAAAANSLKEQALMLAGEVSRFKLPAH